MNKQLKDFVTIEQRGHEVTARVDVWYSVDLVDLRDQSEIAAAGALAKRMLLNTFFKEIERQLFQMESNIHGAIGTFPNSNNMQLLDIVVEEFFKMKNVIREQGI